MGEQFICISCWKEFEVGDEEVARHEGKVVCPNCGYIQTVVADVVATPTLSDGRPAKLEREGEADLSEVAEEISWSAMPGGGAGGDIPIGEEERTDRVEVPEGFLAIEREALADGVPFSGADPGERMPADSGELPGRKEPSEAVLVARSGGERGVGRPVDWQLRTPSGLVFKFTDPDALLGWKKKLATYKELHVSPDGERWVDFSRFVREYDEVGDPFKAFILSESLSDADLPPPRPFPAEEESEDEERDAAQGKPPEPREQRRNPTAPGFTFKVKEEKGSGFGKFLLFALLGLGLGAGIVLAVLYLTGHWRPPL